MPAKKHTTKQPTPEPSQDESVPSELQSDQSEEEGKLGYSGSEDDGSAEDLEDEMEDESGEGDLDDEVSG